MTKYRLNKLHSFLHNYKIILIFVSISLCGYYFLIKKEIVSVQSILEIISFSIIFPLVIELTTAQSQRIKLCKTLFLLSSCYQDKYDMDAKRIALRDFIKDNLLEISSDNLLECFFLLYKYTVNDDDKTYLEKFDTYVPEEALDSVKKKYKL